MIVLGLSGGVKIGNQDPAAALLVDGKLVAAAEEERFIGIKFANGRLPRHAIEFCLARAGLGVRDIDVVTAPGATYDQHAEVISRYLDFQLGYSPPVRLVDHHAAHAASAFFGSGWKRALVMTLDFSGDGASTTVRDVTENDGWRLLHEGDRSDSLGVFYSSVTQLLGFEKDSDEYKIMGMAAYGRPNIDFSPLLEVTADGYCFDSNWVTGIEQGRPAPSKQEPLFDEFPLGLVPRQRNEAIEQHHFDIAASAQAQLEGAVLSLLRHHIAATGRTDVCLAGGVAQNSLLAQAIREDPAVERLYLPPVCSDAGLAYGGAALVAAEAGDRIGELAHAYFGPEFSSQEIRTELERNGSKYRECEDIASTAARAIAEGGVVGWFQGRMEYGPRALGNRSILADPGRADVKASINSKVKFRDEFRPVAPAVLDEEGHHHFDGYTTSPFMTQTFSVHDRARAAIPGVVHADGTSRLQSVRPEWNGPFDRVLRELRGSNGIGMAVNTSLNSRGDPIACFPFQALRTFFATGMDALAIGPFWLEKDGWR